jgi:hypothetical protein
MEARQQRLLDAPDADMIDHGIAVYQHIAKSDNCPKVGHALSKVRIDLREPVQRFADDPELPLHRRSYEGVLGITRRIEPGSKLVERLGGLLHVPQVSAWIMQHRPPRAND